MTYFAVIMAIVWLLPLVLAFGLALACWVSPRLRGWCLEQLIGSEAAHAKLPHGGLAGGAGGQEIALE